MFVSNAEAIARRAMNRIEPRLADKYASLIRFLAMNPEAASAMRGRRGVEPGSEAYIELQADSFVAARAPRVPSPPATVPDEMVSVILGSYFNIAENELDRVKREHQLSMGAENLVGELLERYLAGIMEPRGWIWCSGSIVKAVDFIKPPQDASECWRSLQVKNRDNSENSSSSAIRVGTTIEKWFRTFSRRRDLNWDAFPEEEIRPLVSEAGFQEFVKAYLGKLK
ncbi:MAG: SinI family restriction endonuclease [Achromobacter sp.]|uniref:SinI family restriction endonuclease n=1 Tax=Achromobacter sp. TaxID=134375 RepID=UPI003D08105B